MMSSSELSIDKMRYILMRVKLIDSLAEGENGTSGAYSACIECNLPGGVNQPEAIFFSMGGMSAYLNKDGGVSVDETGHFDRQSKKLTALLNDNLPQVADFKVADSEAFGTFLPRAGYINIYILGVLGRKVYQCPESDSKAHSAFDGLLTEMAPLLEFFRARA